MDISLDPPDQAHAALTVLKEGSRSRESTVTTAPSDTSEPEESQIVPVATSLQDPAAVAPISPGVMVQHQHNDDPTSTQQSREDAGHPQLDDANPPTCAHGDRSSQRPRTFLDIYSSMPVPLWQVVMKRAILHRISGHPTEMFTPALITRPQQRVQVGDMNMPATE